MQRFGAYCRGEYGRVVVATLPSIAAGVLPPLLVDFVAEYPETQIEILDVTASEAALAVQSGAADLAIASPVVSDSLDVELLLRDRFVAVVPDTHPLARRRTLTWRALADQPFIAMTRGSSVRELTDVALRETGATPTTLIEARNIATAGGMIAAGLGVSAFPELVLPLMPSAGIATRPLTAPVAFRDLAIITRAAEAPAPPARHLIERLRHASP
jgi:DNA-binding transcriptional LysR family regulator